jgi:hypothetical protein
VITQNRADRLKNIVIEHRNLREVVDRVLAAVQCNTKPGFSLIIGITGVGKTTAMRYIAKKLREFTVSPESNSKTPPIEITMRGPEQRRFSWADFYFTALTESLHDPLVEHRIDVDHTRRVYTETGRLPHPKKRTVAQMRGDLCDGVNARNPIALFVDEFQELTWVATRDRAWGHLNVFKGLADRIRAPVVGVGTAETYGLLYLNDQIARRANVIPFRRYASSDDDVAELRSILETIPDATKIEFHRGLSPQVAFFYEYSLGCVGTLIDWLHRAVGLAIAEESHRVLWRHIEATRLDAASRAAIAEAIKAENTRVRDGEKYDVYADLGEEDTALAQYSKAGRASGREKPGARSPAMDPIRRAASSSAEARP